MNRNDKTKKYAPLNINNVFKGKAVEPQNRTTYKLGAMQNIGKVSSIRRVPPPKWVPSLKAETGISDGRQIISPASSGWVNPASQDNCDSNAMKPESLSTSSKIGLDKSQWNAKLTTNKPFFMIGQEFPSLQSEVISHDIPNESSSSKELINKFKDAESTKSKIDELRNRDANLSVSTLNRIDALSISKSSKGDIAATGWAAEDEEPNFDEKIIFSDEESSAENVNQNWQSDTEEGSKSLRCDNRESVIDIGSNVSDVWHDPNQGLVMRYSQFHSMQIPVNIQGQFISNSSFSQNMLNRNPSGGIGSIIQDEQLPYLNSVTEQRNVRNMEYMIAIERARQKKLATQTNRGSCSVNEEQNQLDQALMRSRHTSMTSDTTESLNTPIEMGPPGGPPLMHNLHKPHLQPQITPMMHPHNISVISPSIPPQSMIRFAKNQYSIMSIPSVPMEQIPVDSKLMEKFVEFLKIQSNNEMISENSLGHEVVTDKTSVFQPEVDISQMEPERPHASSISHSSNEKDLVINPDKIPVGLKENKDSSDVGTDLENQRKTKNDEETIKYEKSKKGSKSKNYKEYRQNKSQYRAIEYVGMEGEYYQENYDDAAYEDYNTYKQHYSSKEYKTNRGYNNRSLYYLSDNYPSQPREKFSNDYQYKSNSLKLKSKFKDNKASGSANAETLERDSNSQSNNKKFSGENRDIWPQENDTNELSDKKPFNKDRPQKGQKQHAYQIKKFDNRNYKDKSNDLPVPESIYMGFEVKPKDPRKKYFNNYTNSRHYYDYTTGYFDYGSNGGEYDHHYYYSKDYYPYEKDLSYSNNSKFTSNKRNKLKSGATGTSGSIGCNSNLSESWKSIKNQDESKSQKSNAHINESNSTNNQSKINNRQNNRKSEKRPFSTSKDINNDNDQEEWETASEGGSIKSNSASRELHKNHNRQRNNQTNSTENKTISNSGSNIENRKPIINKTGLNYSCNGGNNSFNDNNGNQDGSGGASGSAGGARIISSGNRSNNSSQNKSVDSSTQNKSVDKSSSNENRNSESTFKNCSNNNNSNKENNSKECGNIEKFIEINENEDMLYENDDSQFKEVLSKATKKIRKQEELKRQKEEFRLEQKKIEAQQKSKQKLESNPVRKNVNRRDQNKTVTNMREKDSVSSNNNGFPKWENKVSMQIGSWDNSLADEISNEKKAPPKPIGTPASTVPWNKKVTGSFDSGTGSNMCQHSLSNESVKLSAEIDTICQPFCVSTENSDVNFSTSMVYSSYNSSIYNPPIRASEENNKIESSIEVQPAEITMHETINFEFDVKNINCENPRNSLSTDRVQINDQKLLNDKINSVKTIWDNQPTSTIVVDSQVSTSSSINKDLDLHTVTVSINQDVSSTRNIDNNLVNPSVPNPNVCKVKPQLQHDFKKDHNEIIINSQAFPFRNSPATFLSQNQGNFIPYHRFPDFITDPLHAPDAFAASLISNNQSGMHINYNLPSTHLIDSTLLRQNTQEQMLSSKMNFINQTQSSFYPQQTTTPKLMSNNPTKLPINMDLNSAHPQQHHMPLLLTRQNSLTSMMQPPNPMTIPFIQSAQQPIQAQTPLFPNTSLLGATNFSSQINPFSQGHLQPHYPQFQPNQQMLLNQHHSHPHQLQNHHQKQQLIQGPLSHDQVINTGQSGVFNNVIGPSDISNNTGLPDFNGQPKTLNHHNNIVHGMSGSTFMLPPNLNILVKPSMFGTNSQYNNFPTTIQSNLLSLKSGFEHNNNLKSLDIDHYKHDNSMNDRNIYCAAVAASAASENVRIQKPNEDFYQDLPDYENCDMNYDGWGPNLRYSKVDIYATNNLMSAFDFHSQKSPMQFSPLEAAGDNAYRNYITPYRDNHTSLPPAGLQANTANLQYIISPRIKQQYNIDQSSNIINRQHSMKCFDNQNYISSNNYIVKNESNDNSGKISTKNNLNCGASNSIIDESKNNLTKEMSNMIEKSVADTKKENSKQLSSYSDNFDEKNQSWSLIEDNRNVQLVDDSNSRTGSLKSSNNNGSNGGGGSCGGGSTGNKEQNTHSPNKHFSNSRSSNTYENQCPYGYDDTQLSSQTAESLGKFDQKQLKKVIMKLREGPVMTDKNCNEFDFPSYKGGGAPIPRLMPLQSSRNKQVNNNSNSASNNNKSFNNYNSTNNSSSSEVNNFSGNNDNVGLGFYSRNRALTPPATQLRGYRSNKNNCSTNNNRNQNSILPNNTNNSNYNSPTSTITTTTVAANANRISRQKCDSSTIEKGIDSVGDLKMSAVQSSSMECDNLVLENIIDSPIL